MDSNNVVPPERKQWTNPIKFFLTLVAFDAFLIPYTLMLIFIGALVFYLELTLEQFTCAGPLAVWNVNPLLRGVPSLGNVAYFNALFPYVMLIVLIIREATLSGAIEGIKLYMGTVNFSALKNSSFSIMETKMARIIDEYKIYLNTPKKIVIF
ncbi:unnamed protein product [Rotaria sordida]|uniref:Uncharacterized protein n=1 Tax=Rotaria sordida TaxID=392033 RepID=A0A818HGW3_9BILA|nr:unnamed protein product [Rotaria sordida]